MKVLAVDDDAQGLEIRRLVLERRGFEVSVAASAEEARRSFANSRPEVVVLDLRVPELENGLTLIREFHEFQEVRIVVLCGNSTDLDGRAEAQMVSAILTKPVRSEELVKQIRGS